MEHLVKIEPKGARYIGLLVATLMGSACGSSAGSQVTSLRATGPERVSEPLALTFTEYIRAPKGAVFGALTTAESTRRFFHGTEVSAELRPGGSLVHRIGDRTVIDGEVVCQFAASWDHLRG